MNQRLKKLNRRQIKDLGINNTDTSFNSIFYYKSIDIKTWNLEKYLILQNIKTWNLEKYLILHFITKWKIFVYLVIIIIIFIPFTAIIVTIIII